MLFVFLLQEKSTKVLWLGVVCLGFIGAGFLISQSYKEWQENPIATSITTHPIDNLGFPIVTICPPKDSNTALYHDLIKAGNRTLSDRQRTSLCESAYKILIEKTHKDYAKLMLATLNVKNMDSAYDGFQSLPRSYKRGQAYETRMWNTNGTIATPFYGEDYHAHDEYYESDRDFHMVLELPGDISDQVGFGQLIIALDKDIMEKDCWEEQVTIYTLHTEHQVGKSCANSQRAFVENFGDGRKF